MPPQVCLGRSRGWIHNNGQLSIANRSSRLCLPRRLEERRKVALQSESAFAFIVGLLFVTPRRPKCQVRLSTKLTVTRQSSSRSR
jgi:hypothetical protein